MNNCRFLFIIIVFSLCMSPLLTADTAGPLRGITQDLGEPLLVGADARDQVRFGGVPTRAERPVLRKQAPFRIPLRDDQLVATLERDVFVPAGEHYAVKFDYRLGLLSEEYVSYQLTDLALDAVAIAPVWLRQDLEYKFMQLPEDTQDTMASLILGLDQPETLDEVAFQVAHLSRTVMTNNYFEPEMLEINAELMYTIDQDLQYVEIIDTDLGNGNFYSTTRYQYLDNGTPTAVEIPKEIYYWWIVMPKVSDEMPLMNEEVYDMFWRQYLYYENDSGYPNLQEVMAPIQYLWNGEQRWLSVGADFTADLLAVECVALWSGKTVDAGASGNRPIQPNVIAHEHNGNCGERQDLLCAAGRTCLMPYCCTMDILEDHVWCEMWWDSIWRPTQNDPNIHFDSPYCSYEADSGGSKECSCIWDWRNDGLTWDAIATYSTTCTLDVFIDDPNGVPVDNARVIVASEGWGSSNLYRGSWGETGPDGMIHFVLGDHQNYYIRVETDLGSYPTSGTFAEIIVDSDEHGVYTFDWTTPEVLTQCAPTEGTPAGPGTPYVLEVTYEVPYYVQNGKDYWAMQAGWYAEKIDDGELDFFISDTDDYEAYLGGQAVTGYEVFDGNTLHVYFDVPSPEDFYLVFTGDEMHGLDSLASVTVNLWQGEMVPAVDNLVTGPGPGETNPPLVRTFGVDSAGVPLAEWNAYGVPKYGVNVACGDVAGDIRDEVITGAGPGAVFGPHVRAFDGSGTALPDVSFLAYGTNKYGVNVSAGDIDGDGFDEIVTGAGPGRVFGPHVRGWNVDNGTAAAISAVSFLAYGTNRYGVNVACGDIDGDGSDEIITGAGPGAVFGPHVRGWNYDGAGPAAAIPQVSYFAYGTPRWGVNVACGDIDGDGFDEIITGPGPGTIFGAHLRAWDYDGTAIVSVAGVNLFAYQGMQYGLRVGAADVDGDGIAEILTMPGPGSEQPPEVKAFNVDGGQAALISGFDAYDGMDLGYGGTVAGGFLEFEE